MRMLLLAPVAALVFAGCRAETATPQPAVPGSSLSEAGLERVPLRIRSGNKTHHFIVEVARTPEEQARGLMFRESLGPNDGMIFPFQPARPASFWMKNTLIPLDMLFIRPDGTIARIAAETVPHSLAQVAVGEPVAAVLEIPGGRSAALGIEAGDHVSWGAEGGD